jgi:hypothetical protein
MWMISLNVLEQISSQISKSLIFALNMNLLYIAARVAGVSYNPDEPYLVEYTDPEETRSVNDLKKDPDYESCVAFANDDQILVLQDGPSGPYWLVVVFR